MPPTSVSAVSEGGSLDFGSSAAAACSISWAKAAIVRLRRSIALLPAAMTSTMHMSANAGSSATKLRKAARLSRTLATMPSAPS